MFFLPLVTWGPARRWLFIKGYIAVLSIKGYIAVLSIKGYIAVGEPWLPIKG